MLKQKESSTNLLKKYNSIENSER